MPSRERYEALRVRGLCTACGMCAHEPERTKCGHCLEYLRQVDRQRTESGENARRVRTPNGWASHKARMHRQRVRGHNATHPDHPLLEKIIDGPSLLVRVISLGPTCGLCGVRTGFPWEHVGDTERGPEVDHILSMWAIIHEGRSDWASVSNIRLLCRDCHAGEGVRLRRQDLEERAHMDRMLGKDRD